jgi:carbamoyl-phosphate synthase small subunit
VQYHPEAAAGPHDSEYLFDRFIELMSASERRPTATPSTETLSTETHLDTPSALRGRD